MKSKKLLLAGGDARSEYTEEYLSSRGFETVVYEKERRKFLDSLGDKGITVILPLPITRDGETINITKENISPLKIQTLVSALKVGDTVIGGKIKKELSDRLAEKGITVFDYYDENFVELNAVVTARALTALLSERKLTLNGKKTAVTGFGKCAKAICRLFYDNGTDFLVTARNENDVLLAKSMNYKSVKLDDFTEELPSVDIIVNTVPARILDDRFLQKLKPGTVIVDIASAPFGVDINLAANYAVRVIRALSLPGKYLPCDAGIIIGRKVESFLQGR